MNLCLFALSYTSPESLTNSVISGLVLILITVPQLKTSSSSLLQCLGFIWLRLQCTYSKGALLSATEAPHQPAVCPTPQGNYHLGELLQPNAQHRAIPGIVWAGHTNLGPGPAFRPSVLWQSPRSSVVRRARHERCNPSKPWTVKTQGFRGEFIVWEHIQYFLSTIHENNKK